MWKKLMAILALACGVQAQRESCDNVRREWRAMTSSQQQTFIQAVNTLAQSGQYASWLSVHTNPSIDRFAHNSDGFFPWHRWFVWNFEQQLRGLGAQFACVTVPYWDWASDAATYGDLRNSPVYQAFGGAGNGQCIENLSGSPFRGFAAFRYSNDVAGRFPGGCVSRRHTPQRVPMSQEILDILTRYRAYTSDPRFRIGLRYASANAHNSVHNMIGGTMSNTGSCFEPLFMMHHGFIDKIWATWQSCQGTNNFPATFADDAGGTVWSANQAMPGFSVSPMQVQDITSIGGRGYSYAPSALESTSQWQSAISNPSICAARTSGRDALSAAAAQNVSERATQALDIFTTTMRELASTTNDTDIITYLATRKTCEQTNNIGNYTGPTEWAKNMGITKQELLANLNSPCVEVQIDNIDEALSEAEEFDKGMAEKMARFLASSEAPVNATSSDAPVTATSSSIPVTTDEQAESL